MWCIQAMSRADQVNEIAKVHMCFNPLEALCMHKLYSEAM